MKKLRIIVESPSESIQKSPCERHFVTDPIGSFNKNDVSNKFWLGVPEPEPAILINELSPK